MTPHDDNSAIGNINRLSNFIPNNTAVYLALGFGVKERADVDFLKEKADIAVIGTQTIRLVEKDGIGSVRDFLLNLR